MNYSIESIDLQSGFDKNNRPEKISNLQLKMGNVYAIVGETGSGKSQLLEDIQSLNQGEGVSRRTLLINGEEPHPDLFKQRRSQWIAHLSQNMRFVLDMTVSEFLKNRSQSTDDILNVANTLTGEPIFKENLLTKLSGGQSRALMIADVAFNSTAPIILIDEIENAGIKKINALELLMKQNKIILLITHDPLLALYAHQRIVMKNGGMDKLVTPSAHEGDLLKRLIRLEGEIQTYRDAIREGHWPHSVRERSIYSEIPSLLEQCVSFK